MRGYDRGYDYGLRGWPQAQRRQPPVRTRFVQGGGYGRDFDRKWMRVRDDIAYGSDYAEMRREGPGYRLRPPPNHVTARYNLDYVREQHPGDRPINYVPYGGDRIGRVSDMRAYRAPYMTVGGTRTWRGEWPMDWENRQVRYDFDYPEYNNDEGRWF